MIGSIAAVVQRIESVARLMAEFVLDIDHKRESDSLREISVQSAVQYGLYLIRSRNHHKTSACVEVQLWPRSPPRMAPGLRDNSFVRDATCCSTYHTCGFARVELKLC